MLVSATAPIPTPDVTAPRASPERLDQINSISDFLVHKAQTAPDVPLLGYPASEHGTGDLVEYTARDIDLFTDEAAKHLTRIGLVPRAIQTAKSQVVALLGPSNLDYAITIFALSRMGFSILLLSTRLPTEAYVNLLRKTDCTDIVLGDKFIQSVSLINEVLPVRTFPIPNKLDYSPPHHSGQRFQRTVRLINEDQCVAFIVHSSGSTGLPKPIFQTHRAGLSNYATGGGFRAFVTLPLFHNHGIATMFRGFVASKRTVLYNTNLPLTNQNLVNAMRAADPQSFHGVPYALKVLAESDEGIQALRKCNIVWFGGSSCPDDLGDKLVQAGVYLVGHYGATEMGQLMTSARDPSDKLWNYLRPMPKAAPYMHFNPLGAGLYECMVLDGLPTKVISNNDDPPNSFLTRDTFVPHPTIPNAWKYMGRLDDRVTLVNGEKVLPVPFEHLIRQSELVHECLVFGVGRAFPGLMIVPSEKAAGLPKDVLLDALMSKIHTANERTEKFGRISKEMIEILDPDVDYPRTDKGTMIRAAAYNKFAEIIHQVYVRFETPEAGTLRIYSREELETYVLDLFRTRIGLDDLSLETDFFEAGTDSLQALAARSHIMRQVDLAGQVLGQNVVFENPSVKKLARYLHAFGTGGVVEQDDEIETMNKLVQKYLNFTPFVPGTKKPSATVVLLTGATGTLGVHILSQLLALPHIEHIYCLVRAQSDSAAHERLAIALNSRHLDSQNLSKLTALASNISRPDLGLQTSTYTALSQSVTTIIHSAWAVNFNIGVSSFESQHISGLSHLLRLSHSVPFTKPARFAFISSVSAAAGTPPPASVRETFVSDPLHAQSMGYARSKWVAEHILKAAAETIGQDTRVLRTGQIVADSKNGQWNETEAVPLLIRSAVTIGALPILDETPCWLPVDACAKAVIELAGLSKVSKDINLASGSLPDHDKTIVYHVENSQNFSWTSSLLPALRTAGLQFDSVPQREWIARLRAGEQDPKKNPTIKLLDFYAEKYDNDRPGRRGLVFEKEKTGEASEVIRKGVDVIEDGVIERFVRRSIGEWRAALEG